MRLLVIDTCLDACQAAAFADGCALAEISEPMSRGHQERLAVMAGEVMTASGLSFSDLDAVAVTVGPGSFTGLRVGLAFAKGLGLALGVPCLGVGTLAALAASAPGSGPRCAVIDAGRGQVWRQGFHGDIALGPAESAPCEMLAAAELLVGPTASRLANLAQTAIDIPWPAPRAIARLAFAAPAPAAPLYLRSPDARPKVA